MKFRTIGLTVATSLCLLMIFQHCSSAQKKKYYISATGNDSNDGLSRSMAWLSISKLNSVDLKPGDSVFFEGGKIFKGTILLNTSDNGSSGLPVVISSFGNGKAVIDAGDGEGVLAVSVSNLVVSSLSFRGTGVGRNKGSGIHFFSNDTVNTPENIVIDSCDVNGFYTYGIAIGCESDAAVKGYRNVRITHCNATGNGQGGIASYGGQTSFQHRDIYVGYCKAFRNRGIPSKTENHSGNGIVMGQVDSLLIEHCEAYENGSDNRCTAGGPVGIWVWMCKNAIIQYCVSHDNHAGLTKDGGGFDVDGGASGCIIQYNYSYNNEGAGYLLAEYGALFPFTENTVRFNISENDGRKNNYGAISVWGASADYRVTNSYVYNNTIYLDDENIVNGTPAAVTLMGPHFKNVIIANNIFVTKGRVNFVNSDSAFDKSSVFLLHNNYYSYSGSYLFQSGRMKFQSLDQWMQANSGQESFKNKPSWLNVDPLFTGKSNIMRNGARRDYVKNDYVPGKNSSLRKQKFLLTGRFKLEKVITDLCGHPLPKDANVCPGACVE